MVRDPAAMPSHRMNRTQKCHGDIITRRIGSRIHYKRIYPSSPAAQTPGSEGVSHPASLPADSTTGCPILRSLQDVPEYKSKGLLENFNMMFEDILHFQSKQLQGQPLVRGWGMGPSLITGDVQITREVFSNDEVFPGDNPSKLLLGPEGIQFLTGAKHEQVRGMLGLAFAPDKIEQYTGKVQDLTSKYLATLAQECQLGVAVPVYERARMLTFQVICQVVAGLQLSDSAPVSKPDSAPDSASSGLTSGSAAGSVSDSELASMFGDFLDLSGGIMAKVLPLPFLDLPFLPGGKANSARKRLVDWLQREIDDARAGLSRGESMTGKGLLKELVEFNAVDADDRQSGGRGGSESGLTDEQLIDNMLLFLYAGFDTTSALISSMIYYLHACPQHWHAVVEEQEHITAHHGQRITQKVLRQMPVTERFVRETLRLRPPVPHLIRQAKTHGTISGYQVPPGTDVYHALHYIGMNDPQWVGKGGELDPTVFNPGRFEGLKGWGQQMPFGYGKHVCLGQSLALMEAKVALAVLARGYEVRVIEEPTWSNIPFVHPANGLPVLVTQK